MAESNPNLASAPEAAVATAELSEFDALLQQEFKPKTSHAREAVESAVRTLAQQALQGTSVVSKDSIATIEGIVAELDRKISEQLNLIMHHEDFRSLEGSWRGLAHLVNN